jgi:hypothetical protein
VSQGADARLARAGEESGVNLPPDAVRRVAEVLMRQHAGAGNREHHLSWRDFEREAHEVLEAVAPLLAEATAERITAHMESRGPRKPRGALEPELDIGRDYRAWRRYFGIAARIAAGAFYTDEDKMRLTAEAIGRGEAIVCNPEMPDA